MNQVVIMGRLVKDPEVTTTQSGITISRFTLAVDRPTKKDQKKETDFIRCVSFGRMAEIISNYVSKGQRLLVDGSIRTGSYTDKNGNKRYTTDIAVNRSEFIEKRLEDSTQGTYRKTTSNTSENGFEQLGSEVQDPQWMEQKEIPF